MQFLIRCYQRWVSPIFAFFGAQCRFYPSCSQYSYECYSRYGFIRATWLTIVRVLRCQPWSKGGVDLP